MEAAVLAFRTRWSDGCKPQQSPRQDVSAIVAARLKAAKPLFSKEQLEAASKLPMPQHLFQGEDVQHPKVD